MGSSMALNTLKGGHALVVHDINRDAAAPHLEVGATWADTPRAVIEASEVVFTSLPGPRRWKRSLSVRMASCMGYAQAKCTSI